MEGVRPGNQNTQVHTLALPLAPCVALAKSVHSLGISFLICRKAIITTQMPLGFIQGGNKGQGADFSCLLFCLLGTKITNWLFYTLLTCKKKKTKQKQKKEKRWSDSEIYGVKRENPLPFHTTSSPRSSSSFQKQPLSPSGTHLSDLRELCKRVWRTKVGMGNQEPVIPQRVRGPLCVRTRKKDVFSERKNK